MNKKFYVFAAGAAIIFTNYSNNANAFANFNSIQDTTKAPVEKMAPNNSYLLHSLVKQELQAQKPKLHWM